MNTTWALLWVQLRLLRWPFMTAILQAVIPSLLPSGLSSNNVDRLLFNSIALFIMWLAGPLLFGAEYFEGTREYINSRPVSSNRVFWVKIASLTLLAAVILMFMFWSVTTTFNIRQYIIMLCVGLGPVFFCSAMTLLTRDTIRGMLLGGVLGGVSYFLFTWGWSNIFFPLRVRGDFDYPPVSIWGIEWYDYAPFLQSLMLIFPFLTLWLAAVIERCGRYGEIRVGWRLHLLFLPLLIHAGFTLFCLHHEGLCVINKTLHKRPADSIFTMRVSGNRLYYITHNDSADPRNWRYRLCVVNPETVPKVATEVLVDFGAETKFQGKYLWNFGRSIPDNPYSTFLSRDRIALLGFRDTGSFLYSYDPAGHVSLIKAFTTEYLVNSHIALPGNRLRLIMQKPKPPTEKGINPVYISDLNLSDGSITSATPESDPEKPESQVVYSESRRCFFKDRPDPSTNVFIAMPEGKYRELLLRIKQPVLENTLLAGISFSDTRKIMLLDTADLNEPRSILLDFPFRLELENIVLKQWLLGEKSWGYRVASLASIYRYPVFVTLGGGYLFLWTENNRVAVWDIHDLDHIQFLGMAITPNNRPVFDTEDNMQFNRPRLTTPITRPDGALGLLFHQYGLVWLEFPALMKEAAS